MVRNGATKQACSLGPVDAVTPAGTPPRVVYLYLALIIATWAANWPLMKLALARIDPIVFVALRLLGSVVVVAPMLVAAHRPLLPVRGERVALFWVGQLQIAAFLVCSILGLALVAPGRAIVLAYTMPLWAIPIGVLVAPEPLSRGKVLGAVVGFAGLLLFMNPALVDWHDRRAMAGNGLLLLAAIGWAAGSCLYRRRTWQSPFWTQTFWQLAVGTAAILALSIAMTPNWSIRWSVGLVAIIAYNCAVTTALGYFLWSRVLAALPAAVAGQALTLTPVGGFLLSVLIFGGEVTADTVVSIMLIVAGLVLTLRR
jgi:drug/metabolite transporter (DMT)-like permease